VLCKFPIEFLSHLSFIFTKATYSIDENIFIEKEEGNQLFFLVNGRVNVLHRASKTHIIDLIKDQYFGEISFFTEMQRHATIKVKDFTDVLILDRESFISMAL
jgi:CRP-like cAMP-binding protein